MVGTERHNPTQSQCRTAQTASAAGAVNTVCWSGRNLIGENTDVPAIKAVLDKAQVPLGTRSLVVGAGGAGRATLLALLERGDDVVLTNRTTANAEAACGAIAGDRTIEIVPLESPSLPSVANACSLIINTTSVGMAGGPASDRSPIPRSALRPGQIVFDVIYRPRTTPLLAEARASGCRIITGLEMLVLQGALSFYFWTGQSAPVDVMHQAALNALGNQSDL